MSHHVPGVKEVDEEDGDLAANSTADIRMDMVRDSLKSTLALSIEQPQILMKRISLSLDSSKNNKNK